MEVYRITLLGHKDHGKSTLIGNLLMLTHSVTRSRINEARDYSKKLHKKFEPAFIIDSFHEEREMGLTIDITRAEITYKSKAFSFIDVPGHEELIKNMISGASNASTALLLVSAKPGEGIKGQTKRHLFIARMLGISNIIVAINKMDSVSFSENRFEEIKSNISEFMNKIGFDNKKMAFVPISAYKGDNLIENSKRMEWYKGKPLIELVYKMAKQEQKKDDGALRISLQGFLNGRRDLVAGRIVRGHLKVGEPGICIVPLNINISVKSITVDGRKVKRAKVGSSVALELDKEIGKDVRGSIICGELYCPIPKKILRAQMFFTKSDIKDVKIRFNG
ncbi:MAG: GTP-binding protein, partial [Candidatus Micrarchaeaceae archaeon]